MTRLLPALLAMAGALPAAQVLIVADEFPAMQVLARRFQSAAGAACTLVKQTEMPASLEKYDALVVYIHRNIVEAAEKAFIGYAERGGKLILLHHSISSGKRPNRFWFPFLGVSLPEGDVSQGGYKWIEGVTMELVNLAPEHPITTTGVKYDAKVTYRDAPRDAIRLQETEVYLNHVLEGPRTLLLGVRFVDPNTGTVYMQDRGAWYRPAGKGVVFYFMAGHSARDFEHPAYARVLVNALRFRP